MDGLCDNHKLFIVNTERTHLGKRTLCTLPNICRGMFLNIVSPTKKVFLHHHRLPRIERQLVTVLVCASVCVGCVCVRTQDAFKDMLTWLPSFRVNATTAKQHLLNACLPLQPCSWKKAR
eukprot:1158617-Pelagomonas_calceolata.AAC.3